MRDNDWRFGWFWEVEAWLWWAWGAIEAAIEAHKQKVQNSEVEDELEVDNELEIETQ